MTSRINIVAAAFRAGGVCLPEAGSQFISHPADFAPAPSMVRPNLFSGD